jgi:hypothetical protein
VGAGSLLNNPWDPKLKCMTTDGSYPKRLENDYEELKQGIEFLSCTGDVISNINGAGSHGRDSQLELIKESAETLTILLRFQSGAMILDSLTSSRAALWSVL